MNFKKQIYLLFICTIASSATIFAMDRRTIKEPSDQWHQQELNSRLIEAIKMPNDNTHLIKTILAEGAQVNIVSYVYPYFFKTPLMIAAQHGRDSLCELLINHGAHLDTKENKHGLTALMVAAQYDHESTIKLLIDHGAQINTQGNDEETALFIAAERGHASIAKIILDKGAQFDLKSHMFTALQKAVFNNAEIMIKTLVTFYCTFSPEQEFQISRQRIWTALCVFKRYCALMPKDVRKLILYSIPELKKDVVTSGAFGSYTNLTEEQAPFAPLPIVRLLIEKGKLDSEKTIWLARTYHFDRISTRLFECHPFTNTPKIQALLRPTNFKRNFEAAIEWNIKRRLGLPMTWIESTVNLIPESCSMQ